MYTVKTLRSGGSDVPHVSIGYDEERHASPVTPEDPIEPVAPAPDQQSVTFPTGGEGSCVSLLANMGEVERNDSFQSTSASMIAYGNVSYTLGANNSNQTVVPTDSVITDDGTFVSFENIPYNTSLVAPDGTGVQKFVIIPLSQASCDVESGDSNNELQTAVATIQNVHNQVDSEENILIPEPNHATLQPVHIGAGGTIHIIPGTSSSTQTMAIGTGHYKDLQNVYGNESSEKITKVSQERKPAAHHVQKFTSSELVGIGKSEKEILTEYLEKTKGRRGRPKRDVGNQESTSSQNNESSQNHESSQNNESGQNNESSPSFTEICLKAAIEVKDNGGTKLSVEPSAECENQNSVPTYSTYQIADKSAQNTHIEENAVHSVTEESHMESASILLDPCKSDTNTCKETKVIEDEIKQQVGTSGAKEKAGSIDKTEVDSLNINNDKSLSKHEETTRRSSRKRRACGKEANMSVSVKKPKTEQKSKLVKNSRQKGLISETQLNDTAQARQTDDDTGSDAEGRLHFDIFKRSVFKDKYVVTMAPITLTTMKTKELVIEFEFSDDLMVSEFSKCESSSGTSKYSLSVIKTTEHSSDAVPNKNNTEKSDGKEKSKNKRKVRFRGTKTKRKPSLVSNKKDILGETPEKVCDINDEMATDVSISNNDNQEKCTEGNSGETDTCDIEKECDDQKAIIGDYKIDPLSVITASLGYQANVDRSKEKPELIDSVVEDSTEADAADEGSKTSPERPGKAGQVDMKSVKSYTTRVAEDGTKVYGCPICGHSSKYSQNVMIHISEHSDEKNFVCEECGLRWKSKNRLSKHMIVHKKDRPFTCPLCPQSFKSKPVYICTICGHETRHKQNMNIHAIQHTGDRPYQCEVCGQTFKGPSNLNAHKEQHSDVMKYTCPMCDRAFRDRGTFKQHMRRHMGDKKHVCEHCGKSFVISTDLKKHLRVHTGEKPYCCSVCGKSFADGSGMVRHQKMHSRKTKFQCCACWKIFTRKDLCNYHIKKVHGDIGQVEVREIKIEETKNEAGAEVETKIKPQPAVKIKKAFQPKKTWQEFERLTEEASKRLHDQRIQGYSQDHLQHIVEFNPSGIAQPVQNFHTLTSTVQEFGSQARFYPEHNQSLHIYPQEPIQNL